MAYSKGKLLSPNSFQLSYKTLITAEGPYKAHGTQGKSCLCLCWSGVRIKQQRSDMTEDHKDKFKIKLNERKAKADN